MDENIPILLVEDDPELREALGEYLGACGFSVTLAATAGEALTANPPQSPAILLTDLRLPDRRGDDFIREYHRQNPGCLVYLHSGDSSFVPSEELVSCGLTQDHVLAKPTNLSTMVRQFRTDLKKR